jgi:hypothetical protein
MCRPPVFFREIPGDFTADGYITSRSSVTETGLAVHHLNGGVLAVFDRLALLGAFRRGIAGPLNLCCPARGAYAGRVTATTQDGAAVESEVYACGQCGARWARPVSWSLVDRPVRKRPRQSGRSRDEGAR